MSSADISRIWPNCQVVDLDYCVSRRVGFAMQRFVCCCIIQKLMLDAKRLWLVSAPAVSLFLNSKQFLPAFCFLCSRPHICRSLLPRKMPALRSKQCRIGRLFFSEVGEYIEVRNWNCCQDIQRRNGGEDGILYRWKIQRMKESTWTGASVFIAFKVVSWFCILLLWRNNLQCAAIISCLMVLARPFFFSLCWCWCLIHQQSGSYPF